MSDYTQSSTVPLPKLSLVEVFRIRKDIEEIAGFLVHGEVLEGDVYFNFVAELLHVLPKGITEENILVSLAPYVGQRLDSRCLREIAWKFSGQIHRLKAGFPVTSFVALRQPEWMPLQILSTHRERWIRKSGSTRLGSRFKIQVLAGTLCPAVVSKWWSREQYGFAAATFGFAKWPNKPTSLQHYRHLVGLRFWGLFDPAYDREDGVPTFREIRNTSALLDYNKQIMARRYRTTPCPFEFEHPCHECSIGYRGEDGVTSCYAAFHPDEYAVRPCPVCGEQEASFDDAATKDQCFLCFEREKAAIKKSE